MKLRFLKKKKQQQSKQQNLKAVSGIVDRVEDMDVSGRHTHRQRETECRISPRPVTHDRCVDVKHMSEVDRNDFLGGRRREDNQHDNQFVIRKADMNSGKGRK